MTLHLGRYGGRHPLGVEIDQGERRAAIDDVGGDAGDQVRPRRAVEQHLLGRDRNLVGQIGAQAAERERLRLRQAFDQRAESIDAVDRDALGGAADHHARGFVLYQRAVGRERDLLGQRPAVLGEAW